MAPLTNACPQCTSAECGPYRCRFSAVAHATFVKQWNAGADHVKRGFQPRPDHDMSCSGMPLKAGT